MRRRDALIAMVGSAFALLAGTYVEAQVRKAEAQKEAIRKRDDLFDVAEQRRQRTLQAAQDAAERKREDMFKVAQRQVDAAKAGQAAAKAVVVDRAQRLKQMMEQQLRPILRVEYHFMRTACDPDPEQRREIARAAERGLRDVASRNLGANVNGIQVVQGRAQVQVRTNDPARPIKEAILKGVEEHLSPEQAARYKKEVERREVHRRDVAVDCLVARIDQDLLLTDDQRADITKALRDGWEDAWALDFMTISNLDQYLPPTPDHCVTPFLNRAQKHVWGSSQANRRLVRWGPGAGMVDDGIEDEELTEAREAEDKKQAER